MFSKRSSRGNEPVPRRRRIPSEEDALPPQQTASSGGQFRRNQTLSSYRHNTPEESSRQKAHHLAIQRRKIGGVFLIVAIAAVLLLLLLWQLMAQIHIVTSSKQLSTTFQPAEYERVVNEYLNLNPAQRLRVSLDETALSAYVSNELPEVERLSLSGGAGVAQANFSITYRTPVAGWQINGNQYYVDANGVVFEKNYYDAPKVQIVDESGVSPEQGSAVVGTRLLGFMGRVVAQAQGRGYTVTMEVLPPGTTRQVDV
jgi:cell division septal protein FtsQ